MSSMSSHAMDCDRFIQDIMARPGIWMMKHPERKNKFKVKKLWEDIRKKYPEHSVDDLKKRWKNLKDTFRKELKRLPQSQPGVPAENFKSNWRYFDALCFLREEFGFKTYKESEDPIQIEPDKYTEAPSQSPASPASSKSEEMPEISVSLKRKNPEDLRSEILKLEKKKMKILEEEVARSNKYLKSDNYNFLMSLLPEMDKLPPVQKMRLRTKISQAVLDEVSLSMYEEQQHFNEVQIQDQISFPQESPVESINIIKEEAINMYD